MTQIDTDQPDVDTLSGRPRVVVIGGGLAGLSAAATLVESGFDVQLFESRRNCGGRAASFEDPQDGSLVDACQHVAGDQTSLAEQADVTGMMAGRDEHLPRLLAEFKHLTVGQDSVA